MSEVLFFIGTKGVYLFFFLTVDIICSCTIITEWQDTLQELLQNNTFIQQVCSCNPGTPQQVQMEKACIHHPKWKPFSEGKVYISHVCVNTLGICDWKSLLLFLWSLAIYVVYNGIKMAFNQSIKKFSIYSVVLEDPTLVSSWSSVLF